MAMAIERHIIFKCPRTGLNVQHLLQSVPEDAPGAKDTYQSVVCSACAGLHFLHSQTGTLMGQK